MYKQDKQENKTDKENILGVNKLEHQPCPVCWGKTLTLVEKEEDIPYFGKALIFSMNCSDSNCGYSFSDIESEKEKEPCRYVLTIESEKDLSVRVVKSSNATIKIPQLKLSVIPGPASEGYISNIEGVLKRFKKVLEAERDTTDDETARKHTKNLLKKLWRVECGDMPLKIIIEDPSGNSAIISEKVVVETLKGQSPLGRQMSKAHFSEMKK